MAWRAGRGPRWCFHTGRSISINKFGGSQSLWKAFQPATTIFHGKRFHARFCLHPSCSLWIAPLASHHNRTKNMMQPTRRWRPGAVAALFFVLNLQRVISAKDEEPPYHLPFDYDPFSTTGPPRWGEVNVTGNYWMKFVGKNQIDLDIAGNECDSIRRPSPLNLVANDKCRDNHEILTRQIRDTDCKFHHLNFTITPHTLTATFPSNDRHCERPTIDLPNGYPYRWDAHRIEIHLRAEHVLDGRRYDGELQSE